MEDFHVNNTSQSQSYNNSNIPSDYGGYEDMVNNDTPVHYAEYGNISSDEVHSQAARFIMYVLTCIIIGIGIPLTPAAICALYSMVRSDHVAPIYVINLLISDLIQLCCMIVDVAQNAWMLYKMQFYIYYFGLMASVYFMVCIALERYLVIVHPLWYRFRRTIKISVVACAVVWTLTLVYVFPYYFWRRHVALHIISAVLLLPPFPLLIFFLVRTLKALSASISVPSDEKRRILGVLVLVLLIYTLLFLPRIIMVLGNGVNSILYNLSFMVVRFCPLADLVLYVFMRKGAIDKFLVSVCCCRMDSNDISSSSV